MSRAPGRIRDRRTFEALRTSPRRVRRGPITVTYVEDGSATVPRVAYAIGKRVGGAVQRNRLRRRLRAIVSGPGPELRPGAYLIGAGPAAGELSFKELESLVWESVRTLAPRSDSTEKRP